MCSSLTQSKQQSHHTPHISLACYHIIFHTIIGKLNLTQWRVQAACCSIDSCSYIFPTSSTPCGLLQGELKGGLDWKDMELIHLQGTSFSYLPYTSIDISCGVDMSLLLYAVTYWIMHHAQYFALIKLNRYIQSQFCAVSSFSLLPILLGLLSQTVDAPGQMNEILFFCIT